MSLRAEEVLTVAKKKAMGKDTAQANQNAGAAPEGTLPQEVSKTAPEAGAATETASVIQEAGTVPEGTLPKETSQAAPEVAQETSPEDAGLVRYLVSSPGGIYLRMGPGRAYLQLGVLENGAEVMGVDLAGMLRPGRKPGEAAWIKVIAKDGSGWVDSAFLERVC